MIDVYQPTHAEISTRAFVLNSLTLADFSNVEVVYANQGAVRLPVPFITVQVITDIEGHTPEVVTIEGDTLGMVNTEIHEYRTGTATISCYGPTSWSLAHAIARAVYAVNEIEFFAINEVRAITDAPEPMATGFERRAVVDLAISYTDLIVITNNKQALESVTITGTISGVDAEITENWPT